MVTISQLRLTVLFITSYAFFLLCWYSLSITMWQNWESNPYQQRNRYLPLTLVISEYFQSLDLYHITDQAPGKICPGFIAHRTIKIYIITCLVYFNPRTICYFVNQSYKVGFKICQRNIKYIRFLIFSVQPKNYTNLYKNKHKEPAVLREPETCNQVFKTDKQVRFILTL